MDSCLRNGLLPDKMMEVYLLKRTSMGEDYER